MAVGCGALVFANDANGNRTGIERPGVNSVLAHDAADQLLSIPGDASGCGVTCC